MYCPNCGKMINDYDKFCRYCGINLQEDGEVRVQHYNEIQDDSDSSVKTCLDDIKETNDEDVFEKEAEIQYTPNEDDEELVLYDVRKHIMGIFWPIVLMPVFFIYFWTIFMNTHSLFSWVLGVLLLIPIVYPMMRYYSDKIIITNKFIHIKHGIFNIEEFDIPIKKIRMLHVQQSMIGKFCNYGDIFFESPVTERIYNFKYAQNIDELKEIILNPVQFIKESLGK